MIDIAEFLTARYDEVAELAQGALAEAPHPSGYPIGTVVEYGLESFGVSQKFRLLATLWEPKDVLADIAAKRAIVADYLIVATNNEIERQAGGDALDIAARNVIVKTMRIVLRRLAALYAEHPDFDPAWRIDG